MPQNQCKCKAERHRLLLGHSNFAPNLRQVLVGVYYDIEYNVTRAREEIPRFELLTRFNNLSWKHHYEVTSLKQIKGAKRAILVPNFNDFSAKQPLGEYKKRPPSDPRGLAQWGQSGDKFSNSIKKDFSKFAETLTS